MNSKNERILISRDLGNFLCGDIYMKELDQSKLISEEIDLDKQTKEIFDEKTDLVMQVWNHNGFVYLATNIYNHKRLIRTKTGLFNQFVFHIIQPAKGGGEIELNIAHSKFKGHIIKGETAKHDWQNFDRIIKIMQEDIIPKVIKLFGGKIIAINKSFNV